MVSDFYGPFNYTNAGVSAHAPDDIGVYYCGVPNSKDMNVYYVGRAAQGKSSIRSRLQDHLSENKWRDVTCFGYKTTTTEQEAIDLEAREIKRLQPKYNQVGKTYTY